MTRFLTWFAFHSSGANLLLIALLALGLAKAAAAAAVQQRIDADLEAGRPVVVHVTVALADNFFQGIHPVPQRLGNGRDPRHNLYWGALYGVRSYLTKRAGWKLLATPDPGRPEILERIVLHKKIRRKGSVVPVYLVADAWNGVQIKDAVARFFAMTAGQGEESIALRVASQERVLAAGGQAHLHAYIGHNGLMDFSLREPPAAVDQGPASSAVVLACKSKPYFKDRLQRGGAQPLLLTTGLMAPEAYTLDAAVQAWVAGHSNRAVHEAAARAYHRFQKTGIKAARRLFATDD